MLQEIPFCPLNNFLLVSSKSFLKVVSGFTPWTVLKRTPWSHCLLCQNVKLAFSEDKEESREKTPFKLHYTKKALKNIGFKYATSFDVISLMLKLSYTNVWMKGTVIKLYILFAVHFCFTDL